MARPKTKKTVASINFDDDVLEALTKKVGKINRSSFVNNLVRKAVMSDYEYNKLMAKHHASKLAEYQVLMDSAVDNPRK